MIALGMNVYVADANTGKDITEVGAEFVSKIANSLIDHRPQTGKSGELVCPTAFPSMPVFLWGDKNNKKYKSSYFERFDNICVWAQHDWISVNPNTRGITMHGRR